MQVGCSIMAEFKDHVIFCAGATRREAIDPGMLLIGEPVYTNWRIYQPWSAGSPGFPWLKLPFVVSLRHISLAIEPLSRRSSDEDSHQNGYDLLLMGTICLLRAQHLFWTKPNPPWDGDGKPKPYCWIDLLPYRIIFLRLTDPANPR